jgi:hypothetical protein
MSASEICRHQTEISTAVEKAKPFLDRALASFTLMIDHAADTNRQYRGHAMFDKSAQAELDRINDVTARTMTHRREVEELVEAVRNERCIGGGAACKEICQKLGAVSRLSELLLSPPQA